MQSVFISTLLRKVDMILLTKGFLKLLRITSPKLCLHLTKENYFFMINIIIFNSTIVMLLQEI